MQTSALDDRHPTLEVAVVMRRERVVGPAARWQEWRWVLDSVLPDQPGGDGRPRLLADDDGAQRWLHPGFKVQLFTDEAEGYYLNATTEAPCWFVLWRMHEDEAPPARPLLLTLSYNEAGRWLDAQETVEQVPAPDDVVAWMGAFVESHYVVEPRKRRRPQSFRPLIDRFGNAASVSTGDKRGAGDGQG
ncbi:DUF3305 domain-containing protein [Variovorax sp.]|uniref:DUF3305 domain-containing protein n=1 Tax=Variovorax sp. TaxID=1871043 RepID=UPI002D26CED7|nr:DUF3305 domain-containing protein [Variovorax sp.]HYP84925.1 DUF3305 domain-containing protein [Variovorax sp.]